LFQVPSRKTASLFCCVDLEILGSSATSRILGIGTPDAG
jgi:hypothetical protein